MSGSKEPFRVKLTKEQQDEIRKATGKEAEVLELNVQELEARIAPVAVFQKKLS